MWFRLAAALLALPILLTAGGCDRRLPRLPQDAVILCFGDSLTLGLGVKKTESYPAVLEKLIGRRVINSGISGEGSHDGLQRLPEVLDQARPQLIVLGHGCNDLRDKGPQYLDEYRAYLRNNLRRMLELAKSRGIAVVLLAVPEVELVITPGQRLKGLDYAPSAPPAFYAELAEEFGVVLEPDIMTRIIGDRSLKSDIIHLNAAGYRALAEAVAKVLRENGAIR